MTSRRIFAAVALLCALIAPAHAQKTKAQLNTEIGTTFPDNSIGQITPSGVRAYEADVVNSIMPTAPVVSGNVPIFDGTTGLLKDSGVGPGAVGTLQPGQVIGNPNATAGQGVASSLPSMFDRAYCSTIGYLIARTTGGWTCSRHMPLQASYYGVVCDGVTPMSVNLQSAVDAAKAAGGVPVELPAPTTAGALCVHNANVFTNVWLPATGVLTTPGMDIRGPGRDVTWIDTRVANGAAFSTNPDWQAAYKSQYLATASTGGSGALASNTYYVVLTVTDPLANEVMINSPSQAPAYVVTGPTGRIQTPLQSLNTGYCYSIYISTSPTTTPDHYATVNGADAICLAGNQTVFINAVGSVHAVPTNKRAVWQTSNFSNFSIGNSTSVAGAVGISWFKTAYSTIDKMQIQSVVDGIQILNYAGDADSSLNPKITQTKLDHISGWGINAAGVASNLSYLYLENVICNICGTLPTNYKTPANYGAGFTISTITQNATNVVTTSVPHTLSTNDEVYVQSVGGMTQLTTGWYRVNVTGASTLNLEDLVTGTIVDTSLFSAYTSGGILALAWRPPVANPAGGATNGGGFAFSGLTVTIVHSACTQGSNACVYASESGGSSNLKMIGVTSENLIGKGFYFAALTGGTADGLECLTNTTFGAMHVCIQEGTGFAAGGVSNFRVQNVKVRSDVVLATQFQQFRNTNNLTAFIDTNRVTGVNWFNYDVFAGQTRFLNFTFDPIPGQVRFLVSAPNVWKLIPTGYGGCLPIHLKPTGEWVCVRIPDAGVTLSVSTSAVNTTYSIYATNNAINTAPYAITMTADTSAPILKDGYYVRAAATDQTFVGTWTTDGSGNFQATGFGSSWYPNAIPTFKAYLSADQTTTNSTVNKILINTKEADSNGWYDNATNYRFTPQLAGKYRITTNASVSGTTITEIDLSIFKSGALYAQSFNIAGAGVSALSASVSDIVVLNGTTDYVEVWGAAFGTGTLKFLGGSAPQRTWFDAQYIGP